MVSEKRPLKHGLLILLISLLPGMAAEAVSQSVPRFERAFFRERDGITEIRLLFDRSVTATYELLGGGLFIRVPAAGQTATYRQLRSALVESMQVVQPRSGELEFRIHLQDQAEPDVQTEGQEVLVRLKPVSTPRAQAIFEKEVPDLKLDLSRLPTDLQNLRVKHLTLDPGHGAHDPGAIAPAFGLKEKDLNLDIALKLEALLDKYTDAEVSLTRRGDYFLDLSERVLVANEHRADLFVSLHCNSSRQHNSYGTEVYFFSEKPSDRDAQMVANRENGPAYAQTLSRTRTIDIDEILLRVEQRLFWQDGEKIAGFLQRRLTSELQTSDRGVKSANFAVLREATMPAVLVEMAFIDHARDARRLQRDDFRWAIARSIFSELYPMIQR